MPRFLFAYAMEKEDTSFFARLHPTTMMIAVACAVVIAFSSLNLLALAGLICILFVLVAIDGMPKQGTFTVLLVVLPLCFFISLIQALTNPENIIARLDLFGIGVTFSLTGILLGLAITLRVALLALIMTIFFTVVNPVKLTKALYDLGVPFKFAYTFALALRFLPLVLDELATINNAQKSRGYDIDQTNPAIKIFKMFPLAIPLILGALKRANTIALAMDLKAFNAYPQRTFLVDVQKGLADAYVRAISIVIAISFLIITSLGIL